MVPHSAVQHTGGWRHARAPYLALALCTIAVGLAVHVGGAALDPAVRDVLGDALWASMVAWWVGVIAPRAPLWIRAASALIISFAVEVSQLYSSPALDALRGTAAGHLVLGSGFDPRDLASYTVGVLVAGVIDHAVVRPRHTAANSRKPVAT